MQRDQMVELLRDLAILGVGRSSPPLDPRLRSDQIVLRLAVDSQNGTALLSDTQLGNRISADCSAIESRIRHYVDLPRACDARVPLERS
jgi:hypothetical protein